MARELMFCKDCGKRPGTPEKCPINGDLHNVAYVEEGIEPRCTKCGRSPSEDASLCPEDGGRHDFDYPGRQSQKRGSRCVLPFSGAKGLHSYSYQKKQKRPGVCTLQAYVCDLFFRCCSQDRRCLPSWRFASLFHHFYDGQREFCQNNQLQSPVQWQ